MKINLVSIEREGMIRLATDGAITAADFDMSGKNPLEGVLGANWNTMRCMINFEKTDYIDSSAIGWLIGSSKQFKAANGAIVIFNVQPAVKQILDVLKVGKVVPIADSESAAKDVLNSGAAATGGAR